MVELSDFSYTRYEGVVRNISKCAQATLGRRESNSGLRAWHENKFQGNWPAI